VVALDIILVAGEESVPDLFEDVFLFLEGAFVLFLSGEFRCVVAASPLPTLT